MSGELPVGDEVTWTPVEAPERVSLHGSHILLRPVNAESDAAPLFSVSHAPYGDPAIWTYLPDGPYQSPDHLRRLLRWAETSQDPLYFTVARLPDERPLGLASYLRITPEFGVIEIGHIWFGVPLQRTTARPRRSTSSPATSSTISAIGVLSGSATRSTPPHGVQPSGSGSPPRASSATTRSSRAATATPPGTRSPTMGGRQSAPAFRPGSCPRTSRATVGRSVP